MTLAAEPARPHRDAPAAPAVAGDDDVQARDEQVRGADDAVERRLARAVAVVEEVLGLGLVDGDDRERSTPDFSIARRRMTPVVVSSVPPMMPSKSAWRSAAERPFAHARMTGSTSGVPAEREEEERGDEVRPVVHRQVGPVRQRRADVVVVGRVVLALDRVDGDAVVGHERGGHVVLGRERVRGAERRASAPPAVSVRARFAVSRRDVQAGGEPDARERLLLREALADLAQHRHRCASAHSMRSLARGRRATRSLTSIRVPVETAALIARRHRRGDLDARGLARAPRPCRSSPR